MASNAESGVTAWWERWWRADYSWEGLRRKPLKDFPGLPAGATLQDYWRLDPATGRVRTDKEMSDAGEFASIDSIRFHIVHLPPRGRLAAGWKSQLSDSSWAKVDAIVAARLSAAGPWEGEGRTDARACLQGAVLRAELPAVDGDPQAPLHVNMQSSATLFPAHYDQRHFASMASFSGSLFCESLTVQARFTGGADFDACLFAGQVMMLATHVEGLARFIACDFSDFITISWSKFEDVIFIGSEFSGSLQAEGVTLAGGANFSRTVFHDELVLTGDLTGRLLFDAAKVQSTARLALACETPLRGLMRAFTGTRFHSSVDFRGMIGPGRGAELAAALDGAHFDSLVLVDDQMDGARAGQAYRALRRQARVVADEVALAELDERSAKGFTTTTREVFLLHKEVARDLHAVLEGGCRTLKIAMGKARDEAREQAYYRFQLRFRQMRHDIDPWERAAGWIYGFTSDFGSSLWRPVACVFGLMLLAAWGYFAWASAYGVPAQSIQDGLYHALSLAWRSVFQPFTVLSVETGGQPAAAKPSWTALFLAVNPAVAFGVRVATTLQSVLSGVLLFLFAVAVRRRFQIGG